jgi:hypothetical protein
MLNFLPRFLNKEYVISSAEENFLQEDWKPGGKVEQPKSFQVKRILKS